MPAPSIAWYRVRAGGYTSIASLDFGTVTAGQWSVVQCVTPKVSNNSIQSCKFWMYDAIGVRSGGAASVGSADSWLHYATITGTAGLSCTATSPKGSAGLTSAWTQVAEASAGAGASYAAVSSGAYGDFIYIAIKVPSAAGDGAHTAWGYQLTYSYT